MTRSQQAAASIVAMIRAQLTGLTDAEKAEAKRIVAEAGVLEDRMEVEK